MSNNNGQNPPDDQERRLANPVAAQLASAREVIDAIKALDPDLATRVIAIMAGASTKKPLTVDKAFAAASYEQKTGAVVGRDFYVDADLGNVSSVRGIERDVSAVSGSYNLTFRPLRQEEIAELNPPLEAGDMAVACEVIQLAVYKEVLQIQALEKQLTGQITTRYVPIIGIGVLRDRERFTNTSRWDNENHCHVPQPQKYWRPIPLGPNWSWDKKVRTRAKKAALKQIPGFAASTQEVLEEAALDGVDVSLPEGAHLNVEQAHEFVEGRREEAERRAAWEALTPEQQEAEKARRLAEFQARQRREDLEHLAYEWTMDSDTAPCPLCGAPRSGRNQPQAHRAACEFNLIYPNSPVWMPPADTSDAAQDADFDDLPTAHDERAATAGSPRSGTAAESQAALFPAGDNPSPEPPPATATTAPAKAFRPYTAEQVRMAVAVVVDWATSNPDLVKLNGSYGAALAILDKVCRPLAADHKIVLEALWQIDSATQLSEAQKFALLKWVSPEKDQASKEWIPQQHLRVEVEALLGLTPDPAPTV